MKIVFTNLYSAANRGDAAIVLGMKNAIEKYFSNPEFIVLTKFPEVAEKITGIRSYPPLIESLKYFRYLELIYFLIWAYVRKKIKLPTLGKEKRLNNYLNADLIISVGGGYLNDNHPVAILRWLFEFYFSKLLGKKVVIYANSVGPFEKPWTRFLTHFVFNKLDLITLRDKHSEEVLKTIGIDPHLVNVTADAAWCMKTINSSEGLELLKKGVPNFNEEKLNISISVRHWKFYKGDNEKGHLNFINSVADLLDHLVEFSGADIFLLSTSTSMGGYANDDRIVSEEIVKKVKDQGRISILRGEYSPQQLSAIYANMDLHIGTRMHSNILSILGETPVVAIEYEPKTEGMMKSLDLTEWIIKIDQINSQELVDIVDRAIKQKEVIKSKIIANLPDLRKKSLLNAKLVYNLMSKDCQN